MERILKRNWKMCVAIEMKSLFAYTTITHNGSNGGGVNSSSKKQQYIAHVSD